MSDATRANSDGRDPSARVTTDCASFVERTVDTYRTLHARFTENHNALWRKYQTNKTALDERERSLKCLDRIVRGLNETNETVRRRLKEREDSVKRLEESLIEEKRNAACLNSENQNHKIRLEKTFDELSDTTRMLNKTNDELDKKTEEHCSTASALEIHKDKLSRAVEKHNIEKLQLIKNNNIVNTELDIQKYRNAELHKTVCERNCQLQHQTELLEKSNEQNEILKQIIAKEMIQANESIDKSRKDKLIIINEKEELEMKLEEYKNTFALLEHENEQLKTQINELQFKLDTIVKNGDEKLKLLTEKMGSIDDERKQLNIEMTSMNQINAELEKRLAEAKKMHNVETENVYNLERRLKYVCHKPIEYSQRSNKSPAGTGPFFHSYTKVLDELSSTDEYSYLKSEDSRTESLENNSNFEKLISKCETIINSFNK